MLSRQQGAKEASELRSKMTKPVFESHQCGRRWTEGKETEDREMCCAIASAEARKHSRAMAVGRGRGAKSSKLCVSQGAYLLGKKLAQI